MGPIGHYSQGPGALAGTPSGGYEGPAEAGSTSLPGLCQPLAPPGRALTFLAAARAHAGLEVLGVGAGDAEVQLSLQHALPHPLAFVAGGGAAGGPRGPVGVDAGFGGVIWNEYVTGFPGEPAATGAGPTPTPAHLGMRRSPPPDLPQRTWVLLGWKQLLTCL